MNMRKKKKDKIILNCKATEAVSKAIGTEGIMDVGKAALQHFRRQPREVRCAVSDDQLFFAVLEYKEHWIASAVDKDGLVDMRLPSEWPEAVQQAWR
jgi:hypothetical protein